MKNKKTFDMNRWLQSAPAPEDHETMFLGESIKIRALRGADWEEYIRLRDGSKPGCLSEAVLYHGIVGPNSGKYSRDEIQKLFHAYTAPCAMLMQEILVLTDSVLEAEYTTEQEMEKNSETTGTAEPSTGGAGITEPTLEQQS